jgi:DNA-binding NarL/FixJ family response regulator
VTVSDPIRVVIGEDDVLLREGVARLLSDAGVEVVARCGDAETFLRRALAHRPDVVVVDVQMPPGHGDDGLVAAIELRRRLPDTGVLVLSQTVSRDYALELIRDRADGVGYLLKTRIGDVESFVGALTRVAAGGCALDPELVNLMVRPEVPRRAGALLDELSPREREVLAAMAEGSSNQEIADALTVSDATVEKHITSIFNKLGLGPDSPGHSRVKAVLMYLRSATS